MPEKKKRTVTDSFVDEGACHLRSCAAHDCMAIQKKKKKRENLTHTQEYKHDVRSENLMTKKLDPDTTKTSHRSQW